MLLQLPIIMAVLLKLNISRNVFNNIPLCEPGNANDDGLLKTVFDVVGPRSIPVYPCIDSDGEVKYEDCDEENIVSDVVDIRANPCGNRRREIDYTDVRNAWKTPRNSKKKK